MIGAEEGSEAAMIIFDAQVHIWAKGTPSAHHRQGRR
jgi:hypothetical protein